MTNFSEYWQKKLACAYFFACPGLVYGIFTSRLPALKSMTLANDAQIGLLLLAFGVASFTGLLSSRIIMDKFGTQLVTGAASISLSLFFIVASYAVSFWHLFFFGMLAGLFMGLCDVAMNAQGIIVEKTFHKKTISFFHASYSLGAVLGSLAGSLFAAFNLSPFLNFIMIIGFYLLLWPMAYPRLLREEDAIGGEKAEKNRGRLPFFVYLLGFLCMCCYVAEGSVGEWGSILLHSVKGASQEQAALVFAFFSCTMVAGRFMGDNLRSRFSDFWIVLLGSSISGVGMLVVLLANSPSICLVAYAVMGIGFAPIVPIFYSRAGNIPGVSAGHSSSAVSLFAYSGLLVFPPFIGVMAEKIGLDHALWLIILVIFCIGAGSFILGKKKRKRAV